MASEVKANKLSPSSGTDLTLGDASDTVIVPTGATLNIVDGLGVAAGGTGLASFTAGDVLYATGTTTLAKLAKGTAEQILSMNSGATAPEWTTAAATAGGTGQTAFTAGDILYANSTTTLTKLAKGTGLQGLQTNSGATAPEWAASPQSVLTATGDILYASGANTLARLAKGSGEDTLKMNSGATAPEWVTVAAATSDCVRLWSTTSSGGAVSEIDVTSVFSGTYKVYKAYVSGLYFGANQYPLLAMLVGGTPQTSSYYFKGWNLGGDYNADTASSVSGTSTSGYEIFGGWYPNNTDVRGSAEITFYNPYDSTYKQAIQYLVFARYPGIYGGVNGYGFNDSAFAATGFRLFGNSGSIQDGCTISVYGFKYA